MEYSRLGKIPIDQLTLILLDLPYKDIKNTCGAYFADKRNRRGMKEDPHNLCSNPEFCHKFNN